MNIPSNNTHLLSVENLKTSFKTKTGIVKAVDGIGFYLNKGETVGVVGESGSGKSVTALSLMRLIESTGEITDGKIIFQSPKMGPVDIALLSDKQMRKIRGEDLAMIFQEPMSSLNPVFTCGNQVMEAIRLHRSVNKKEAKKRTIALFEQVQLPQPEVIFDSYPHEISGGQKQRVMIAMALSCEPRILIADEPTTALDVTVQKNILNLLRKIRDRRDTAIIFISHDLGVIAEIADRVLVMYKGKVVEQGPVYDIFSNPKHPYTKGLLACRPRLDLKLKVLPTIQDFLGTNEAGDLIERGTNNLHHKNKYHSVGEAILKNVLSESEIDEKRISIMKNGVVLEVKNLKTYFPITQGIFQKVKSFNKAVDDVSFKVYRGETLGLVGESGCGKTTLGRTLASLIEPTAGDILFEGKNLKTYNKSQKRKLRKEIQIIFQDPYSSLNPRMTIGEAIIEPMKVHGILSNYVQRKEKAISLLKKVKLEEEHFQRFPHEFSGGQRQRVCIARTLALNPKFIICDESVSALDVSVQARVLNLLNSLKKEFGFTYIFISHDLSVIKFIADRILVMHDGKIVEKGYPEIIFESPRKDYTKKLIQAIPQGSLEDIRMAQLKRQLN